LKVAANRASAFLQEAWSSARGVLCYGPDVGLARERGQALIERALGKGAADFCVSALPGSALKDDRRRLIDELATVPFGGGARVVSVREGGDGMVDSIRLALSRWPENGYLVVEAGELPPRSSLRQLFEAEALLAAVPCYGDTPEAIVELVRGSLAAAKIAVSVEALDFLGSRLGGDRLAVRAEIEKLKIYAASSGVINLEDALECAGAWNESSLDEALHAACTGDVARLDVCLENCLAQGMAPVMLLRGAMRHVERLLMARAQLDGGAGVEDVVRAQRPPIFFRHVDSFKRQLRTWSSSALRRALDRLLEAESRCKSSGGLPDEAIGGRAFYELAMGARREGARSR
jgi:DNA polymerase-3 subunit delta